MALLLSIPAGIPVLFLAVEWGFVGGLEDRWEGPYAAGTGVLYAGLVFAYTFPATRRYWGDRKGAVMSVLTGVVGWFVGLLGSLGTLIIWLGLSGYGE